MVAGTNSKSVACDPSMRLTIHVAMAHTANKLGVQQSYMYTDKRVLWTMCGKASRDSQ